MPVFSYLNSFLLFSDTTNLIVLIYCSAFVYLDNLRTDKTYLKYNKIEDWSHHCSPILKFNLLKTYWILRMLFIPGCGNLNAAFLFIMNLNVNMLNVNMWSGLEEKCVLVWSVQIHGAVSWKLNLLERFKRNAADLFFVFFYNRTW